LDCGYEGYESLEYRDGIVVCFKKKGKTLHGEIQDMPVELLGQWAGEAHIQTCYAQCPLTQIILTL
jgi:hypothetical protein